MWESIDLSSLLYIGSAGQFFNHQNVDWLYFTGGFLQDPIIRGVHTTQWVRRYIVAGGKEGQDVAHKIRNIHTHIEHSRQQTIPNDAFRDVLFMSLDMGIRAYEMAVGPLPAERKVEFFQEIMEFGRGMHIADLPANFEEYAALQHKSLEDHYQHTHYSDELFAALRTALGPWRFLIAKNIMVHMSPPEIKQLLPYTENRWFPVALWFYRRLRNDLTIKLVFTLLVPRRYHSVFFATD